MPSLLLEEYRQRTLELKDLAVAHYLVRQLGYLIAHSPSIQRALAEELSQTVEHHGTFYSEAELHLMTKIAEALRPTV